MNNGDKYPPDEMLVCYNGFFRELYRHNDFRLQVKKCWEENAKAEAEGLMALVDESSALLKDTAVTNGIRWNRYITTDITENEVKYEAAINDLKDFISKRIEFFDESFVDNSALIFYSANDAYARYKECDYLKINDTAKIIDNPYDCSRVFLGWNTAPDGSGTNYMPGDEVTMNEPTLFLYAQWSDSKSTMLRIKYKLKDIYTEFSKDFIYRLNDIKGA